MTTLYTKGGRRPQPLPGSDQRLSDSFTLMPLDGHPDAIAACGWVEAPPAPAFDPDAEQLGWDGAAWIVEPLPADVLAANLEAARAARWEEAKAFDDARSAGGFDLPGVGPIQTDQKSIMAIDMLVEEAIEQIAAGNVGWTVGFLNRDNVEVQVTAPQILLVKKVIRGFFAGCYQARQANRAAIYQTTGSCAQVRAIDLAASYAVIGAALTLAAS